MSSTPRLLSGKLFATLLAALPVFTSSSLGQQAHPFTVTLDSKMTMALGAQIQNVDSHTELDYTWTSAPKGRSLILDQLKVRSASGEKVLMDSTISRTKFKSVEDGKSMELTFEQSPPALQTMLEDTFAVTIFEMTLDNQGQEAARKTTAKAGAEKLLNSGVIANALLFHPLVPAGQTTWDANSEVSMGNGGYAKGKLTYKKLDRPGEVYAVSGTLTNDKHPQPGSPVTVKNARYLVAGEQTYDPALKEWSSGKLKLEVTFALDANEKQVGTAKGTMDASLVRRK